MRVASILSSLVCIVYCSHIVADAPPESGAGNKAEIESLRKRLEQPRPPGDVFLKLHRLLDSSKPDGDPDWEKVFVRCCDLVAESDDAHKLVDATYPVQRLSPHFPELAERCLESLLKGLEIAGRRNKCEILKAIAVVPMKSQNATRRLRLQLDEKASGGTFVSIHAARAIGILTPDAAERTEMLEWLRTRLDDREDHVRWMCADALGSFHKDAMIVVDSLTDRLRDESATVRAAAARAIWRISGDSQTATKVLVDVLRGTERAYYDWPVSIIDWTPGSFDLALHALDEIGIANDAIVDAIAAHVDAGSTNSIFDDLHVQALAVKILLRLPITSAISSETRSRVIDAVMSKSHARWFGDNDRRLLDKLRTLQDR